MNLMKVFQFRWFWFFSRFGPYFIEPIIAGLDPKTNVPFVASCDLIGCPMIPEDFVVTGTCSEQLYGMCESLWEPDLVSVVFHFFSFVVSWNNAQKDIHLHDLTKGNIFSHVDYYDSNMPPPNFKSWPYLQRRACTRLSQVR